MNVKFFKYTCFLVLFLTGCNVYDYQWETARVEALIVEPPRVESYDVTVDDYIYLPSSDPDKLFDKKWIGSHREERVRRIPEKYYLSFKCQHGIQNARIETEKYPILRAAVKQDIDYLIRFGTNRVLGLNHDYVFEDLNQRKTLEGK